MPVHYLRALTNNERNQKSNFHLAGYLAFVAGAANAGGFLAAHQYTSHMSGIVSTVADGLALQDWSIVLSGASAVLSFVLGAACSAMLINWGRRQRLHSIYAIPLLLEAVLLIWFGLMGSRIEHHQLLFVPTTVALLCFMMGLQNAMVTKLSNAEIRTTHVTGMVTDIGIEVGKLFYWNSSQLGVDGAPVIANRAKLRLLGTLVFLFFSGGVIGALGFKHIGFHSALALAALLTVLAAVPIAEDLGKRLRDLRSHK